ncbi:MULTISPECIES: L-lactate dehydrogenase [Peptoniphilus]|uniref:L-lactate dehydrogenase n=2 Tax=Peptoniphilus lacrimalis TaxID=33031 RepID=D1VT09_9FIRM|nr:MULTISPECIES: L-lactate dehydrogenase [Peptoniphilus]KGF31341.1 lactate dehydrogenase [Peptoniphilus lacrimalis DNF00528]EFA90331.1 L-lactate dehydrogenase [Peptoniphilus lacrimalis 315-B]EFK39156.1 L-lactate dehydrogenase [Peptoniphilus sp. oral taxon 836 str. F0141]MDK7722342.1 L-lactate dehydrogenase [Peptoniphilus lacrimalis]MDK7731944.1 L-lactate dehydrogenase [Peptoniphilus lacrimalis]
MIKNPNFKVILVGDGSVGSSFAFAMTLKGLGRELGIIDINKKKTIGDAMDLNPVLTYNSTKLIYSADYSDCKDADLVVITSGAPQKPGETRLQLVDKNLKIIKDVVDNIMKSGFDGLFLVAANPVDILSYAVKEFSGFPRERVISSGTSLDSARFCDEISRFVGVDRRDITAYIMGEHGDSSFPCWSNANIAGKKATEWIAEKTDDLEAAKEKIYTNVRDVAYRIIENKGATYYGVATVLARICRHIIEDSHSIITVGACLEGEYGLSGVYMGTPCVIGRNGIEKIIEVELDEKEKELMEKSFKALKEVQDKGMAKVREN